MQAIYSLPLFLDATDDEMSWLIDHSYVQEVAQGEYFFREGDPARQFYVVLDGELQITRTVNGEQIVLGTTPRGIMGGETFLLSGNKVETSACAIEPSRLMVFDLPDFLAIFTHSPSVGIKILRTAAERMQGFATLVKQQEKMAALGKLAAGLAHELNNPAAAAKRSANELQELQPRFRARTLHLGADDGPAIDTDVLTPFLTELEIRNRDAAPLSTLEQSEREDELGDWLADRDVKNSWEIAATFVGAQMTLDDLTEVEQWTTTTHLDEVITWLHEALTVGNLLGEIEQSTERISDLVVAIKSYTYMDRGVLQDVDIHKDLDNTLLVLKHRLRGLEIERQYDPDLPIVQGRGGELNQVWTNLIDNAADALEGQGTIRLTTRCENDFVMVEVADDGPGIPPEIQPHLFEPFFTTKEVGSGTGLGLDISYRIAQQHNGTIEVRSEPGNTRFIVRIPRHLSDHSSAEETVATDEL